MHEYRRFIQARLDEKRMKQSELARAAGLSRQLISTIMTDRREHLGQMPDESTLAGLAKGLNVSVDRVRTAAARSLTGFVDDGRPLAPALDEVSLDALLNEIRRRVEGAENAEPTADTDHPTPPSRASRPEDEKIKPTDLNRERSRRRRGRDFDADPIVELPAAAYMGDDGEDEYDESEAERARRLQDEAGEGPQE